MYLTASPLTKIDRRLPEIKDNNYNAAKPKTRLLIALEGLTGSKPSRNRVFSNLKTSSSHPRSRFQIWMIRWLGWLKPV